MQLAKFLLILLCFSALFISCKKEEREDEIDISGSVLDTNIDTVWTAPGGGMKINLKISAVPEPDFYIATKMVYDVTASYTLLEGSFKPFKFKLKYRHFPQNYSEVSGGTGLSYMVHEEAYSNITWDNPQYSALGIYNYIPDPGPIDRIEISLK